MSKVSAVFYNRAYKFVNLLIDVIHRGIMVYRAPYEPKTQNRVDMSKFTLVFEDDFNGEALDETVWSHNGQGERRGGYWDKGQTFVRNGNLIIKTEYKENGPYGAGYYSDRVDTREFIMPCYGYFECRCILPAAQGLWSAFWISNRDVSIDGNPGTNGTEIDVFESPLWHRKLKGKDNGMITSNLHYGGYHLRTKYKNVTVAKAHNPYEEYNTYGVEWSPEGYIFYINGRETARSRFGGVSRVPQYLELSVEVDGVDGEPYPGWSGLITRNKTEIPAEFKVDYVRAYQYTELLKKQEG